MDEPGAKPGAVRETIGLVALLAALLFGGMAIGVAIAVGVAGQSVGAVVVGFFALPLAFGLSLSAWRGVVMAWLMGNLAGSLVRSRGDEERFRDDLGRSFERARASGGLPGTWVFVPICAGVGVVGGAAMAIAADQNRIVSGATILVAAVGYGIVLRRLARRGLLPIPEE